MKKRILWYSNAPWSNSGYGKITRTVVWNLKKDYDFAILNNFGFAGAVMTMDDVVMYPHYIGLDENLFVPVYNDFKADLMIINYDLWGLTHLSKVIKNSNILCSGYIPIDHYDNLFLIRSAIDSLIYTISFSEYGYKILKKEKIEHCTHIPPPLSSDSFCLERKSKFEILNIDEDAFLISMIQMNRAGRKNIPRQLEGISYFIDNNKDIKIKLYLHMQPHPPDGDDLRKITKLLKIDNHTKIIDEYEYLIGIDDERLSNIYKCSDVTVYASSSEGFGMPIIESLACGTPVIAANNTSMTEILKPITPELLVASIDTIWMPRASIRYYYIDKYDLADKLQYVLNHQEHYEKIRKKLSDYAIQKYGWKETLEKKWKTVLEEIFNLIDEYCLRIPYDFSY